MMGRFLIFFSYIGTRYSGVQQQLNSLHKGHLVRTVGGTLEQALEALRPANQPVRIQVSSRTDKGVHAVRNSCHTDLQHPTEGEEYDPAVITNVVNYTLAKMGEDVRVLETRQVPDTFHSQRNALGRKYVYRVGHLVKPGPNQLLRHGRDQSRDSLIEELKKYTKRSKRPAVPVGDPTPISDHGKICIVRNRLDINKLVQAAELLSGIHDFTSFSNKARDKSTEHRQPHPVKLLTIGVKRGQPFGQGLLNVGRDLALTENIEFWDIHVRSKSFLYKMVRRLVGGMILHARGAISLAELADILENPRREFPLTSSLSFSESGLFLTDVEYNPSDFDLSTSSSGNGSTFDSKESSDDYNFDCGEEIVFGKEHQDTGKIMDNATKSACHHRIADKDR